MTDAAAFAPLTEAELAVTAAEARISEPEWTPILPVPEDAPPPPQAHQRLGRPSATWKYRDTQGRLLGLVARLDTPEGKQVLPVTFCEGPNG